MDEVSPIDCRRERVAGCLPNEVLIEEMFSQVKVTSLILRVYMVHLLTNNVHK